MTAGGTEAGALSGGCQCGAVRFRVSEFGRASLCHCRMCQKAFGGIGGALVGGKTFAYTRGAPSYFLSSNKVRRGFCNRCGTPLTFETDSSVDFAIAAFDTPEKLPPVIQMAVDSRLVWVDHIASLPTRSAAEEAKVAPHYAGIVSNQHPDHDTDVWPPRHQQP
jgi:hypothetical protein